MDWMDWKSTLLHFLKSGPGSNGVPLNYFIRDNVASIIQTNTNILDENFDRVHSLKGFLMSMHPK